MKSASLCVGVSGCGEWGDLDLEVGVGDFGVVSQAKALRTAHGKAREARNLVVPQVSIAGGG